MASCDVCGRPVLWAKTTNRKNVPLINHEGEGSHGYLLDSSKDPPVAVFETVGDRHRHDETGDLYQLHYSYRCAQLTSEPSGTSSED